jgi:hypothetical protein
VAVHVDQTAQLESKCFANSQSEGVTVPTLRDIGAKIHVIFRAQLESQAAATAGQKVVVLYPL